MSNTEHSNTDTVILKDEHSNTVQPKTCKHCGKVILNAKSVRREYCDNEDLCKHSFHAKKNGVSLELYRQGLSVKSRKTTN